MQNFMEEVPFLSLPPSIVPFGEKVKMLLLAPDDS